MKKTIILTLTIVAVTILTVLGVREYFSYSGVTFKLAPAVSSINVYNNSHEVDDEKPIAVYKNNGSAWLKNGSYIAKPVGDITDGKDIVFVVGRDKEVVIDPEYSDTYLAELATNELPSILAAYQKKFPTVMSGFTINNLQLLSRGDWVGVLLTPINLDAQSPENLYRSVAHKQNGIWSVVGIPRLVLTLDNTPGVARDVLTKANKLSLL